MMTFEQIYKKYYRLVYSVIKKLVKNELDAEELTSEAMIRIHKSLPTYKEDMSKISTWLFHIAKNIAIDFLRKKRLQTVALEETYVDWTHGDEDAQTDHLMILKCSESNPEETMIGDEVKDSMMNQFSSLSESEKAVATSYYFDGLSYEEVATELNMPLGTVKAKIHNARVTLMEAFPVEMRKLATIKR